MRFSDITVEPHSTVISFEDDEDRDGPTEETATVRELDATAHEEAQLAPRGPVPEPAKFDITIAGARFSKSGGGGKEGGGGTAPVAALLASQLLLALRHLREGGSLVLVLNVTPLVTYFAPLCLLREYFEEVVASKPSSMFQQRASCYVAALGFRNKQGPESVTWRLEQTLRVLAEGREAPCTPFSDTTPAALMARHGDALEELMQPLWQVSYGGGGIGGTAGHR